MNILQKLIDECREIREDIEANASSDKIQEEIGDLLHAAISLCVFSGFDVEETLEKTSIKFGHRMDAMKKMTKELGMSHLNGQSTVFMLSLWDKVKMLEKNTVS